MSGLFIPLSNNTSLLVAHSMAASVIERNKPLPPDVIRRGTRPYASAVMDLEGIVSERNVMLDVWTPRLLSLLRIAVALFFMEHGMQKLLGFPPRTGPGPRLPDPALVCRG